MFLKTVVLLKLRLFAHSFSPRHTPYDNEKKLWLEREGKSQKRYVLLLSPRLKRRISEKEGAQLLIDSCLLFPVLKVSYLFYNKAFFSDCALLSLLIRFLF